MRNTRKTSPASQVDDVKVREDTPHAINLRIVLVDLRNNEKDEAKNQRRSESRYQRIGLDIQLLQSGGAGDGLKYLTRQSIQLGYIRLDCLREVAAVRKGLDERKCHQHFLDMIHPR